MDTNIQELLNRAEHLRQVHDYDGAVSAYENILAEHPGDAAARWGLVLSRYGIEYTHDAKTDQDVPGINRMSLDSVLEDRDYLLAVENADEETAEYFRTEARRIAAIQEQLADIVRREKPFDVFISFKSGDGRKRTRDYALAQEIYDALTAEGFRVFFSPVTLRQHPGEVYEPYIFSALYTAKVMVLVGTRREYLESEWVKNEWSRYLFMMRSDTKKHLLPVYEGMNPADFPAGIGRMQGIDLSGIGAVKTVVSRVKDLAGEKEKIIYARRSDGKSVNLTNLMRRIQFEIEDGAFEEAGERMSAFIEQYGEDYADLRYSRLLLNYRARNAQELSLSFGSDMSMDEDYLFVMNNGSDEQINTLLSLEDFAAEAGEKKRIAEGIPAARKAYSDGEFGKAIDLIDGLRRLKSFDREKDVSELYSMAVRQKEIADKRAAFLELTKQHKHHDYLEDRLEEVRPDLYEKYAFVESMRGRQEPTGNTWGYTLVLAVSAVTLILYLVLRQRFEVPALAVTAFIALILAVRFFIANHYDDDTLIEDAKNLIASLLKGAAAVYALPVGITVLAAALYSRSKDRDHGFLAAIDRIWYHTDDAELVLPVFLLLPILLVTVIICAVGARKEKELRLSKEKYRLDTEKEKRYRKELRESLGEFVRSEEKRVLEIYGDCIKDDLGKLGSFIV